MASFSVHESNFLDMIHSDAGTNAEFQKGARSSVDRFVTWP